jgi:hypothetical protein
MHDCFGTPLLSCFYCTALTFHIAFVKSRGSNRNQVSTNVCLLFVRLFDGGTAVFSGIRLTLIEEFGLIKRQSKNHNITTRRINSLEYKQERE